jgi:predicted pyridoxine 5'-phosphate oxidase superfamily flavin-nucleotide-binding protein
MTRSILTTPDDLRNLYEPARERSAAKQMAALDAHATRFVALAPFVVVATGGVDGMDASPRGGAPGFVKVVDAHTLLIPDSPGSWTPCGILHTPQVGLLILVRASPQTPARPPADPPTNTADPPSASAAS